MQALSLPEGRTVLRQYCVCLQPEAGLIAHGLALGFSMQSSLQVSCCSSQLSGLSSLSYVRLCCKTADGCPGRGCFRFCPKQGVAFLCQSRLPPSGAFFATLFAEFFEAVSLQLSSGACCGGACEKVWCRTDSAVVCFNRCSDIVRLRSEV